MNVRADVEPSARQELSGRVALVTGSTSGIGLGIAKALAAAGADVVLNGLGPEHEAEPVRQLIARDAAVRVVYVSADMSDSAAIARMIDTARETLGTIDILVNNAGVQHVSPVQSFPPEKWDAILAVNLTSAFHTSRLVLESMQNKRFGRIINIASAHGLVASPFKSAYVAAKHGLIGLTKTIALEAARSGVTCNAICPGYVWTPLVERQIEEQAKAHGIDRQDVIEKVLLSQQPNKTFATVEEIGALAVFLSTTAAQSITGAALPVDGGWTAH